MSNNFQIKIVHRPPKGKDFEKINLPSSLSKSLSELDSLIIGNVAREIVQSGYLNIKLFWNLLQKAIDHSKKRKSESFWDSVINYIENCKEQYVRDSSFEMGAQVFDMEMLIKEETKATILKDMAN